MTRILITTNTLAGHVRPCLPVARELTAAGHDVVWYTGRKYGALVTATGARLEPCAEHLDFDDAALTEGRDPAKRAKLADLRQGVQDVFIAPIPGQVADLQRIVDEFRPEVVLAEAAFMAGPVVATLRGIPAVLVAVSPLAIAGRDVAPFGTGLPPSSSPLGRLRNRTLNWAMSHVLFAPAQRAAERALTEVGMTPPPGYFMDWGIRVAQRYLAAGVPELDYPRTDLPAEVEHVGGLFARTPGGWIPPAWWPDVEAAHAEGRPVVVVTQGTLATNPDLLLRPSVAALADSRALVVATTVGHDPDDVFPPAGRPANLRVAEFVPHSELLPLSDVFVTNGGFGGVQTALTHGVPLVVAGTTEDKLEVGARVAWAGAGVALRTDTPSAGEVASAVDRVLGNPAFRGRARALQESFGRHGGPARVAEVVLEAARPAVQPAGAPSAA